MFDLRWNEDSVPDWRVEVESLYDEIWDAYSDLISRISIANQDSIDWWVTPLASRNEYKDPLFHYCCGLAVLKKKLSSGTSVDSVLVDGEVLGQIVERYLEHEGYDLPVNRHVQGLRGRISRSLSSIKQKSRFLSRIVLVKLLYGKRDDITGNMALIDTFSIPGCEDEDRYYGSFHERLSAEDKLRVRWVPHFVGLSVRNAADHLGKIKKLGKKYLIKEKVIRISDVIFILFHGRRVRGLSVPALHFDGYDVTGLIRCLLKRPHDIEESYSAVLNYRFARRLRLDGFKPAKVIDWYENQAVDKGWNLGFNRFFPELRTTGYQGAYSDQPRDRPTIEEVAAGVCPAEIVVMGKGMLPSDKIADMEVEWRTGPAFRYEWLLEYSAPMMTQDPGKRIILVLLPIETLTATYIVNCIRESSEQLDIPVKFLVKPHPAASKAFLDYCRSISTQTFEVLSDVMNVREVSPPVVICGGISTTPLEILAIGKKLVYLEVPGYSYQTPRLDPDEAESFARVRNSTQLVQLLHKDTIWQQSEDAQLIADKIKATYFEPITEAGVNSFLD